ncbi:unnamed protein product [Spirodela intermedia]|uniref:Uncharacterized protein n=2 Tax=Spirodela intermedia TaxID=51605 RepID=A0A7I8IH96_SPIIN|nr:unnamed protein product [Spirodela intermedia]CAA6657251.1 unnamed protein product [Spirodela intermedia]CAA7393286.1 unnamed protein product [Spirodela intermedia]
MVGIFSRLYGGRSGHRRTQSAIEVGATSRPSGPAIASTSAASASSHGMEIYVEFKPVEHPTEPLDHAQPLKCPLPEPSIINDGRIWKERMSANAQARTDILPIMKESSSLESEASRLRAKHLILPSFSAPEHKILNLLEECNNPA